MMNYYNKYNKYIEKYNLLYNNNQNGGKEENTFYIKTDDNKFDLYMKKNLIKKDWQESNKYPVNFIFLQGESAYYRNKFDSKQSDWISLLKGRSKEQITNKFILHKNFNSSDFFKHADFLENNNLIQLNLPTQFIKILKPSKGFAGKGIKIVKNKKEIEDWLDENKKYDKWLLEDYIRNPDLLDGHKFNIRVHILVKVVNKKQEIYKSNIKFYVKAVNKYKPNNYDDKSIHDTHYQKINPIIFPINTNLEGKLDKSIEYNISRPDDWDTEDINKCIEDINTIIQTVFTNQIDFEPEWNAKNGFELFGADFMFEKKHTYLLEINQKTGLKDTELIIPGIIETVLDNKKNEYFTKLEINQVNKSKTFFININNQDKHEKIFEDQLREELITRNYTESSNFPVDFIFLSGELVWYRNRFDTKKSKWLSLLYGKSIINLTNKILFHKKFEKEDFLIHADFIKENKILPKLKDKFMKILKPVGSWKGMGNQIVKNKKEVEDWIQENTKFKEWVLEDYIVNPDLKDGHKFHFRIPILVKVLNKKISVYISNKYYFRKAVKKYKKSDWLNKDIHDTHFTGDDTTFPDEYPDKWNDKDADNCINKITSIIKKVFANEKDFRPDWDAQNAFDVYGADILFEKKQPYLLEINQRASLIPSVIPGMLSVVLDNQEIGFTKLI